MLIFCVVLLIGLGFGRHLQAQVEEFIVASGLPLFGEQPLIQGNIVVWQRYESTSLGTEAAIQFRDLSRMDSPVVNVAPYPAYLGGVVLGPSHLFWGGDPIRARPIDKLADRSSDVLISTAAGAVAATREYVFLEDGEYDPKIGSFKGKFFAKPLEKLSDPDPTMPVIAEYRYHPFISRYAAASEEYFVWQDRDPDEAEGSWKIYAKGASEFFTQGAERLVLDTKVFFQRPIGDFGVYLGLHGHILILQSSSENSRTARVGIHLMDLRSGTAPMPIAVSDDPDLFLDWPAISEHYAVWTEDRFFERRAFALRIIDGHPSSEPFQISSGTLGGSWITIDRNIAVWNGATSFGDAGVRHQAIVAAELPLPGAEDVGDVDQDGGIGVTDAIIILRYLFQGGWKPRLRLGDANADHRMTLSDAIVILRYAFAGGPRPGNL